MKDTINNRIMLLKTDSGLTNLEFCHAANISHGTLNNIQNGENVSPKTIKAICDALHVNKDWLMTGKGEKHNTTPKAEQNEAQNPWRDALVSQIKDENNRLQKEVERLWQMVSHYTSGVKPDFLNALENAYTNKLLPGLGQLASVSGAKLRGAA